MAFGRISNVRWKDARPAAFKLLRAEHATLAPQRQGLAPLAVEVSLRNGLEVKSDLVGFVRTFPADAGPHYSQSGWPYKGVPWFGFAAVAAAVFPSVALAKESEAEPNCSSSEATSDAPAPITNDHTAQWRIYTDMGRELFGKGKHEEAERYLQRALQEARIGFGEREAHVAAALNNLAELYRVQRNFSKAEPLYLEALKIITEALGQEHPSTGSALHNLGGFYLLQRDFDSAKEYYERALKAKGGALGQQHPEYAASLFHLAEVVKLQGSPLDAAALVRQSLSILEEAGMVETLDGLRRYGRLAQILIEAKKVEEAEPVQRRILQMFEAMGKADTLDMAVACENLAQTLESQQKWEEATALLTRGLRTRRALPQPSTGGIGRTLRRLAEVYLHMQEAGAPSACEATAKQAHEYAQFALEMAQTELERALIKASAGGAGQKNAAQLDRAQAQVPRHVAQAVMDAAQALRTMAATCSLQGRVDSSEEYLREAVRQLSRSETPSTFLNSPPVRKEMARCLEQLADIVAHRDEIEAAQLRNRARTFASHR